MFIQVDAHVVVSAEERLLLAYIYLAVAAAPHREARPGGRPVPMTTQVTARHSVLVLPLAAALVALTARLGAASVPLYAMTHQNWLVNGIGNIVVAVLFAVVGFVIVCRQRRNPIGWILLIAPAGSQLLPADAASYALLA